MPPIIVFGDALAGRATTSERVLYLDSDTCAGPGLADLLCFDLAGRPLAAHLAPADRPLIRRAARKLGVPAGGYFNSGVLLVDLGHPETAPGAHERTLEIARRSPEKLTCLDSVRVQSREFEKERLRQPDAFNFFVRPEWEMAPIAQDAPVIHSSGNGEAWDPAYGNANNVALAALVLSARGSLDLSRDTFTRRPGARPQGFGPRAGAPRGLAGQAATATTGGRARATKL